MKKVFVFAVFLTAIIYIAAALALPSIYVAPILMYHNIDEKEDILSVPPEDFERQMKFLNDRKYNVIGLNELVDLIIQRKKIPPKTVIITFDDGYQNNFTNACPILMKYNMPATFFVIPNHCDWEDHLNNKQLKEMAENGFDIESHTLNDVWLPTCDEERLNEEIAGSKKAIEEIIDKRVDFISYPLGGFDERVRLAVMKAGYKGACATKPGRFRANGDIYALKRLKVSGKNSHDLVAFWFKTTGYYTWFVERELKKDKK